jgi:hypothetical protein
MSNEVEKNYKITATPDFADQNPNGKTFVQSKTVIVFSVALISWLLTYFKLLPQDAIDALAKLDWTSPTVPVLSAIGIVLRAITWDKITGIFKK